MRRPGMWIALGAVTLGVVLFGASGCGSSSSSGNASGVSTGASVNETGKPGGTIKAAWHGGIDFIDPALAYYQESWQIEYATCVNLLGYPDKPAPEGYQLQPEAASAMPTISSDGLTVTFTVPPGKYKFNTGEPVTAQTFADSLMRDLNPKQVSPFVSFVASSIEGADGWNGKGTIPGVQVNGDQLILHLTKPNGTIEAEMATPFMCAIPHDLPISPKGVTEIAGAGPYYIASYTPNRVAGGQEEPQLHRTSSAPDRRDRLQSVRDRPEPGHPRDQERPAGLVSGLRDGSSVAAALPAVRRGQPRCPGR